MYSIRYISWIVPCAFVMWAMGFWAYIVHICGIYFEVQAKNKSSDTEDDYKKYKFFLEKGKRYTVFFFIEGNILWLGILAAYLIQISDAPGIIGRILNTGIYIPMVFLICSKVIKCAGTIILKEYDVLEQNIRWSILLLTLSLDICLFLLNWEMALFIAAILMGKFIWLDSGTAEILEYIKGLINCFKNTELTTAKGLSMLFGKCMISIEIWLVFGTVFMWVIGIISFS